MDLWKQLGAKYVGLEDDLKFCKNKLMQWAQLLIRWKDRDIFASIYVPLLKLHHFLIFYSYSSLHCQNSGKHSPFFSKLTVSRAYFFKIISLTRTEFNLPFSLSIFPPGNSLFGWFSPCTFPNRKYEQQFSYNTLEINALSNEKVYIYEYG